MDGAILNPSVDTRDGMGFKFSTRVDVIELLTGLSYVVYHMLHPIALD